MATTPGLIAVVGPTASGKTSLALDIAERWNGEIICADSRTIYKGMDIGTAKPTPEEQARVPHWGLDLVEPGQSYSVADFQKYAVNKISEIQSRAKVPLLVGGTGLYVDSVLYRFSFGPPPDPKKREKLEAMSVQQLIDYCLYNNVKLPQNPKNKRHLIHAIERKSVSAIGKSHLSENHYIVGIATNMKQLRTRINLRSEQLFKNGVEEEAMILGKKYGWDSEAMTGNIYPLIKNLHEGKMTFSEVKDKFTTRDYQLAKRQMTWFRRNPDIMWTRLEEANAYVDSLFAIE